MFIAILAQSANGFGMPKSAQHLTSLKMSDPWAPNTATTNTVDMADLKYVFYRSLYLIFFIMKQLFH